MRTVHRRFTIAPRLRDRQNRDWLITVGQDLRDFFIHIGGCLAWLGHGGIRYRKGERVKEEDERPRGGYRHSSEAHARVDACSKGKGRFFWGSVSGVYRVLSYRGPWRPIVLVTLVWYCNGGIEDGSQSGELSTKLHMFTLRFLSSSSSSSAFPSTGIPGSKSL